MMSEKNRRFFSRINIMDNRIYIYDNIKAEIDKIVDTDDQESILKVLNNFKKIKKLGSGADGDVYLIAKEIKGKSKRKGKGKGKVIDTNTTEIINTSNTVNTVNTVQLIVKVISISEAEDIKRYDTSNINKIPPDLYLGAATVNIWREIYISEIVNQLVCEHKIPNFPLIYGHAIAESCYKNRDYTTGSNAWDVRFPAIKKYAESKSRSSTCVAIFGELFDIELYKWFEKHRSVSEWLAMFFQIWFAQMTLRRFNILHRDANVGNILLKKIKKGGYWTYTVPTIISSGETINKKYYIPNFGYQFVLNDYGNALSSKFKFNKKEREFYNKCKHEMEDLRVMFKWINYESLIVMNLRYHFPSSCDDFDRIKLIDTVKQNSPVIYKKLIELSLQHKVIYKYEKKMTKATMSSGKTEGGSETNNNETGGSEGGRKNNKQNKQTDKIKTIDEIFDIKNTITINDTATTILAKDSMLFEIIIKNIYELFARGSTLWDDVFKGKEQYKLPPREIKEIFDPYVNDLDTPHNKSIFYKLTHSELIHKIMKDFIHEPADKCLCVFA